MSPMRARIALRWKLMARPRTEHPPTELARARRCGGPAGGAGDTRRAQRGDRNRGRARAGESAEQAGERPGDCRWPDCWQLRWAFHLRKSICCAALLHARSCSGFCRKLSASSARSAAAMPAAIHRQPIGRWLCRKAPSTAPRHPAHSAPHAAQPRSALPRATAQSPAQPHQRTGHVGQPHGHLAAALEGVVDGAHREGKRQQHKPFGPNRARSGSRQQQHGDTCKDGRLAQLSCAQGDRAPRP